MVVKFVLFAKSVIFLQNIMKVISSFENFIKLI